MQTTTTTDNNNKLLLLFSRMENGYILNRYLTENLQALNVSAGYNFPFQMPVLIVVPNTKEVEKKTLFGRKPYKKTIITGYNHVLVFPKALTDEELYFWRVFKLGFLTRHCRAAD